MRKLISKPFADTPEKRDHMDKIVCNMVDGLRVNQAEAARGNSVLPTEVIKGKPDYGDWHPRNGVDGSFIFKAAKPRLRIESDGSYGNAIVRMAYERLISSYEEVEYCKGPFGTVSVEGKTKLSVDDGAEDCYSNGYNHGYIKAMILMFSFDNDERYACSIKIGRKHTEVINAKDKELVSEIQEKADQKQNEIKRKKDSDFIGALLSAGDAK